MFLCMPISESVALKIGKLCSGNVFLLAYKGLLLIIGRDFISKSCWNYGRTEKVPGTAIIKSEKCRWFNCSQSLHLSNFLNLGTELKQNQWRSVKYEFRRI